MSPQIEWSLCRMGKDGGEQRQSLAVEVEGEDEGVGVKNCVAERVCRETFGVTKIERHDEWEDELMGSTLYGRL